MNTNFLQKYRYSAILLRELVITEFKLRYQGSVLGYLWSLLKPLFLFAILYVVFAHFFRLGGSVPNFPVYLLLGIVMWTFFSEVTNQGVQSIVSRGDVIRKINFPKYVIVLASTISAGINMLINLAVIMVFMVLVGAEFSWSALLFPFYLLELFAFALAVAFILGALFVKLRDINYIWEVFMQAFFYATPILYPLSLVLDRSQILGQLMLLNPVAHAIQGMRAGVVTSETDTLYSTTGNIFIALIPPLFVIALSIFAVMFFKKRSPYFAEEV